MLTAKIDCMKIEKARLFKGKDGAQYLDMVFIPTPNDKHGNDYMIVQSITKAEREAGKKGIILGNAKVISQQSAQTRSEEGNVNTINTDDLPF